jgi:hypothetical protein
MDRFVVRSPKPCASSSTTNETNQVEKSPVEVSEKSAKKEERDC